MKTLLNLASIVSCAALTACSTTATLIPTAGPLAKQGAPHISATVEGILGNSGPFRFTMPDGEQVVGEWVAVMSPSAHKGAGTAKGNKGSQFDFEFECDSSARGIGKATDNRGNCYRILVKGI
jgi:hypothetical protein